MPRFKRLYRICPPLYDRAGALYRRMGSPPPIRSSCSWPSFPRLQKVNPSLYDRANDLRSRIFIYWHWWRSRRLGGQAFLPALRGFAFTTRSYFQRSRSTAVGKVSGYIAIDDAPYFKPPAPKTLGDTELATRLRSANPPLFAAQLRNASTYGEIGDVITADGILLADVSYLNPSDLYFFRHRHPIVGSDPLPESRLLKGIYALLTAPFGGSNYFHWMFSLLPRLTILQRAGVNLASIDGFLINRLHFPDVQWPMLRGVGIQPEYVIEMDETDAFQPQVLWITSNLHYSGHRAVGCAIGYARNSSFHLHRENRRAAYISVERMPRADGSLMKTK